MAQNENNSHFGDENAKTRLPSEPSGISTGDRNQKRKGKDAQKVELAAVPEHYMAFGTEGESQRLPIDAAAVEDSDCSDDNGAAVVFVDSSPSPASIFKVS
mgnify:CR=1 FL=1